MAILDTITKEAVADRFFTLPEAIKDILGDTLFMRIVREACSKYQVLDGEHASRIEMLAGSVLLGFIHPDEVAQILEKEIGLEKMPAQNMAADLRAKLFDPLKEQLDSLYKPLAAPAESTAEAIAPAPLPVSAPAPAAATMLQVPAPAGLPTTTLPEKPPSIPAPTPTPQPTNSAAAPAPFILHQETTAAPLAAAGSSFKLKVSSDIFTSPSPSKKSEIPLPPKVAELEIGKATHASKASAGPMTAAPTPSRIVHYSDLKTATAPAFTAPHAPTPTLPTPPRPTTPAPTAPKTPTPPTPPAPPKAKVVNFGPEEVK